VILNIKICNKLAQLPVLSCTYVGGGCIQISVSIPNDLKRSRTGTPYGVSDTKRCNVGVDIRGLEL